LAQSRTPPQIDRSLAYVPENSAARADAPDDDSAYTTDTTILVVEPRWVAPAPRIMTPPRRCDAGRQLRPSRGHETSVKVEN
jgi:hypothetical protein